MNSECCIDCVCCMLYVVYCMWMLYVNVERMCISLDTLTQRNAMLWDVKTQTQNVLTDNQSIDSPKENSNSTKTKTKIKTKIKNLTNNFNKIKYDQNQFESIWINLIWNSESFKWGGMKKTIFYIK